MNNCCEKCEGENAGIRVCFNCSCPCHRAPQEGCDVNIVSSRVCERGTKSCTVVHAPQEEWEKEFDRQISSMLWDYQQGKDTLKSFIRSHIAKERTQAVAEERREIIEILKNKIGSIGSWQTSLGSYQGLKEALDIIECRNN